MKKYSLAAIQQEIKNLKESTTHNQSVYTSKGIETKIQDYLHRLSTPELRELISEETTQNRLDEIMSGLEMSGQNLNNVGHVQNHTV